MEKSRSLFWDNFKGILIVLVVFGHFIYSYATDIPDCFARELYVFIYSFHMPAFIFCSGYFSKSARSRSVESLTKLFVYYAVFNTLMLLFEYFDYGSKVAFLTPYYSYWYILSLITWRAMIGKLSLVKGIVPLTVIISMVLGFNTDFTNLLSLRRTLVFFPFFAAGYLLDKEKVEAFLARRKARHMVFAWIPVLIVAATAFQAVNHFGITPNATLMIAYSEESGLFDRILMFSVSVAAIVGMFLVVPNCRIPLLSKMGKNSLLIYLVHRFAAIIYYRDLFPYADYTIFSVVHAAVAAVILCVILSSDRLNRTVVTGLDKIAAMLTSQEDKKSAPVVFALICLFLGLLLLKEGSEIAETFRSVLG